MFNLVNNEDTEFFYEYVSFFELYKAYEDCKKRKRSTHNCEAFEINEYSNLWKLYIELNTFQYKIGRSTCFIYHEPETNKYREIFAADFRDRIIQHLLVNRIINIFENTWTDRSFSCRKNKGTLYGVRTLYNDIKKFTNNYTKNCYIINFDIYSFFASLDKDKIYNYLKILIYENYKDINIIDKTNINKKDLIYTLYLVKLILYNDPRKKCIFKQPKSFWNNIPKHKSAFYSLDNHYLAVGNITSQLFANIFLSILESTLLLLGYLCGRYVDDIYVIVKTIEEYHIIETIITNILSELGLKLQVQKTHIQPYQNGIQFIGKIIKKNRIYLLNKTKGKCLKRIHYFSKIFYNQQYITIKDLEYIVNCINSYLGMMKWCNSYKLRKSILSLEMNYFGKYIYTNKGYSKIIIKKKYKTIIH